MAAFARARPDPLDRRLSPRSQTDVRALIRLDGAALPCAIRDRSEGGARLVLAQNVALPPTFDLTEMKSGRVHRAQLVWSGDREVGVRLFATARPQAVD